MAQLTQEQFNTLKARGLSDQKIKILAEQNGYDLPSESTGIRGVATGVVKGGIEIARDTAQLLQGAGQRVLAGVSPKTLEEVRETTGFKSLDDTKPEGVIVSEMLEAKSTEERIGKIAANVAMFFVPTSKATQVTGRIAKGAGETVSKFGIGVSAKEAPLLQAYKARTPLLERISATLSGTTPAGRPVLARETALKRGIFGTESLIGVQSKRAADNVWKQVISPSLKQNPVKIQMSGFIDDISKEIDTVEELSRKRELQNALRAFSDDYKDVGEISLEQLQRFKEGWAKFLPDKVYKGKPIAQSFREIQNIAAQKARNTIYNAFDDDAIRAAYFDYGNLKNLQELGQRALTKGKFKGGFGSFASGVLDTVLTPIASTGGLVLYKAGQGLEFIGTKGLKTVKQIFGL